MQRSVHIVVATMILGLSVMSLGCEKSEKSTPTSERFTACLQQSGSERTECLGNEFSVLVDKKGLVDTVQLVEKRSAEDSELLGACHMAFHAVGEARGKQDVAAGKDPAPEILGGSFCSDGYVHGYYIAHLNAAAAPRSVGAVANTMCVVRKEEAALVNCIHSVGHAAAQKGNEDFAAKVCQSLAFDGVAWKAQTVPFSARAQFECEYGAYMERALTIEDMATAMSNSCTGAPTTMAKAACYSYLPKRIKSDGGSAADQAAACAEVQNSTLAGLCVYNAMRTIGKASCAIFATGTAMMHCQALLEGKYTGDDLIAQAWTSDAARSRS